MGSFSSFVIALCVIYSFIQSQASDLEPDLPFGDVNVVILTDVHSWVAGHGPKESLDADYGDVLSFFQRLRMHCDSNGMDLFFVVNGDWVDGTGLALNGDPSSLVPLLEKMPWDAVNIGNHELYRNEIISYMTRPGGYVEWWGEKYLSSNIVLSETSQPIGSHYRLLEGPTSTVLTFGFLYNMKNHASMVTVVEVETIVQQSWFKEALGLEYDAILVLAHMGAEDPLVDVLTSTIRQHAGELIPIQFITGHTHRRQTYTPDSLSHSVEAGRYLDTVGFVSFPRKDTVDGSLNNTDVLFQHVFVNASKKELASTLGVANLPTSDGRELSQFIHRTREELGLLEVVGCVSETYYLGNALEKENSLWRLFRDSVVPTLYKGGNEVFFLSKWGFRYDLLKGQVTLDEVLGVSPFNETFMVLENIPGKVIQSLNAAVETPEEISCLMNVPDYILAAASEVRGDQSYNLVTDVFEISSIHKKVTDIDPDLGNLTAVPLADGRTTTTIWIDFLESHGGCHQRPTFHFPGTGKPKDSRHEQGHSEPNAARDRLMVTLAGCAMAIVVIVVVLHVRGRGRIYREYSDAQHELTLEAFREAEDEEGRFV